MTPNRSPWCCPTRMGALPRDIDVNAACQLQGRRRFSPGGQAAQQPAGGVPRLAGRSYSLAAHTLPSARGQGEPLTGRQSAGRAVLLSPCSGATRTSGGCWLRTPVMASVFRRTAGQQTRPPGGRLSLPCPGRQGPRPSPIIDADTDRLSWSPATAVCLRSWPTTCRSRPVARGTRSHSTEGGCRAHGIRDRYPEE